MCISNRWILRNVQQASENAQWIIGGASQGRSRKAVGDSYPIDWISSVDVAAGLAGASGGVCGLGSSFTKRWRSELINESSAYAASRANPSQSHSIVNGISVTRGVRL